MKRLLIVRHAKSSWDFPHLSDFERPLNNRGKRDVPDMARRFWETAIEPQ
ncbi:MAG: histidine phosphatase family protein, partial [Roseivirga sp.]|nr:histidine phosphatase family protein [Roseivirga sp.]